MAKLNKTSKSQVLCTLARLKRKGLTDFAKARKQRIVKKLFHLQPSTMALNSFFYDTLPVLRTLFWPLSMPSLRSTNFMIEYQIFGKDYSGAKFFYTEPISLNKAHSTK